MDKKITKKLAELPKSPGVYFHKNAQGQIIYVGKAANLRNRVRQYFQKSRYRDAKTDALVAEIADIDWTVLDSEADALFVEAELVRRYQPSYNILLRDDKSLQYVRIDYKSDYPTVQIIRRPLDDGAEYFGPYINGFALKKALRYLRRAFPYATKKAAGQKRASLHYHIGLDPGLESGRTSLEDYRANLKKLMQYLRGNRKAIVNEIESSMKAAAKVQDFEAAARYRNQLFALRSLSKQVLFGDRELQDASKDEALSQLGTLLGISQPLRRIEGYDISHHQGSDTVGSMVVFSSGVPLKTAYRKFKMRTPGNDDFGHMKETLNRRLSAKNRQKWPLPDLFLIDGGKGQLSSALEVLKMYGLGKTPVISLAKREEEIVLANNSQSLSINQNYLSKIGGYHSSSGGYSAVLLPSSAPSVKLLQRIRDESHRFAVSYHSSLKRNRQISSSLDAIPGVGPTTRKKLIRRFGSAAAVSQASREELVDALGIRKGQTVYLYLHGS